MTSVLDCATVKAPEAVPDLGVTTPAKSSNMDIDPMLHANKIQRLGPPTAKARLVPIPKNGIKSPKRYAANGVRMSPKRRPLYQKNRGHRRTVNAGHEGLPIEAYSATPYESPKKRGFSGKLYLNAPEFSPNCGPLTSPLLGMNPSAPEFSPSASSLGMSPLARPFTRAAAAVDIGLSPMAVPFVPSSKSIPEQMPLMDLGQSLRSALSNIMKRPNPVCINVDDKLYEIYEFKSL